MKRKHNAVWLFALCLFCTLLLCPMAAFAKSAPKKLFLNHKNLTLYEGETELLQVLSVKPKKASNAVTWKSIKPGVASVSSKGRIVAKKTGKTIITATSRQNPNVSESIKITVKKSPIKVEKEFTVNGGIYDISKEDMHNLDNNLYKLATYHKKKYAIIRSKEAFENLAGDNALLSSYAKTNFKKNSLVFIRCYLFRAYDERVAGFTAKFDASGKLRGQVLVQYKRKIDDPECAYPAVMDDYLIVLRLSKKDAAMIDYFQCKSEEI